MEGFKKTPARKAREQIDFHGQKKRRRYEYDPAFEEMKRAFGHSRTPAIHSHANHSDPESVHRYGDRDAGKQHQGALPERRLKQICRKETQAEEREWEAQPTAGIA